MDERATTFLEKPSVCPACKKALEASTHASGHPVQPQPGDLSICFECGATSQFTKEMGFELCDIDKLSGLDAMDRAKIRRYQAEIVKRRRI